MLPTLALQIWSLELWEIGALLGIGVLAGLAGGLLGIGGAVINIPAISLLIGRDIHLAQAAAMNVTFFVALPSAIRHYREGSLDTRLLKYAAPAAVVAIMGGVMLSVWTSNEWMARIFGIFLIFVIVTNVRKILPGRTDFQPGDKCVTLRRGMSLGGIVGTGAGLLGIGGGLLAVPLSQQFCRLTLPSAIATSSAIMCFTSLVGASVKDVTLPMVTVVDLAGHDFHWRWFDPFKYAIWLIPTCILGSWFGARLTHVLPLKTVRIIFILVVAVGAAKMLL